MARLKSSKLVVKSLFLKPQSACNYCIYGTFEEITYFSGKNIGQLKDKKIIVFCDGASPFEEKAYQELKSHNMKSELAEIPLVYCRGSWNMDKMGIIDKKLCKMLQKVTAKKNLSECEIWEKALMEAGETPCDWTDRKYIKPILDMLK